MLSRFTKPSLFYNLSLLELRFTTRINLFPHCIAETQFPSASAKEHRCAITRERMALWFDSKLLWPTHQGTFLGCRLAWLAAHRAESAEWVKSHRPASQSIVFQPGWGAEDENQTVSTCCSLHTQHTESSPKDAACFFPFLFTFVEEKKKKNTTRKCCFRTLQECNRCDRHHWRVAFTIAKACSVTWKTGEKASERKRNLVCGSARGCQGVGHPLVQKSRCRSLPKKFQNPYVLPKREACKTFSV